MFLFSFGISHNAPILSRACNEDVSMRQMWSFTSRRTYLSPRLWEKSRATGEGRQTASLGRILHERKGLSALFLSLPVDEEGMSKTLECGILLPILRLCDRALDHRSESPFSHTLWASRRFPANVLPYSEGALTSDRLVWVGKGYFLMLFIASTRSDARLHTYEAVIPSSYSYLIDYSDDTATVNRFSAVLP